MSPRVIERTFAVGDRVRHTHDHTDVLGTVTKALPAGGPPEWYEVEWDEKPEPDNQYMWMVLDRAL